MNTKKKIDNAMTSNKIRFHLNQPTNAQSIYTALWNNTRSTDKLWNSTKRPTTNKMNVSFRNPPKDVIVQACPPETKQEREKESLYKLTKLVTCLLCIDVVAQASFFQPLYHFL